GGACEGRARGRGAGGLGGGGAGPLAGVVAEPREAELVVAATPEEGVREPAEDRPAAHLLRGEPTKPAVEDERGVVSAEPAAPVGLGRDEQLRGGVHAGRR